VQNNQYERVVDNEGDNRTTCGKIKDALGLRTRLAASNKMEKPALEVIDKASNLIMAGASIKALADCLNAYLGITMKHSAWPGVTVALTAFINAWIQTIGTSVMIKQVNTQPRSWWQTAKNVTGWLFMTAGTALFGYGANQTQAAFTGRNDSSTVESTEWDTYAAVLGPILTLIGAKLREDYLQRLVEQKHPVQQVNRLGVDEQNTQIALETTSITATEQQRGVRSQYYGGIRQQV